ncbi:MAG: AmmeMemoRadiSam system protein A [Sedimenticolaceae bacterium]|nr:AmmeMemoRadiSam system protein A [Sedimenticolaceae bacterium]
MALTSSTELGQEERRTLLRLARDAIRHGLEEGHRLDVDPSQYDDLLSQQGASFVTLTENGNLRGCIGTLQGYQPLVADVAAHAHDAAFRDPRFPPLSEEELDRIEIAVSVLGEPEEIRVTDEQDLCRQLVPGTDGVILEYGSLRGTFLPSVWESLPDCAEFVRHLKQKAGLSPDFWADEIRVYRYRTESFSERDD